MKQASMVRVGGLALVFGAVAFMAVFAFLAARFDYPEVLDGPAATVLPSLLETGASGRAAWAFYAFLPLIWLPAGVGAYCALHRSRSGLMLLAPQCAVLAAISMMLGLMRWPTIHWHMAQLQATATPDQQEVIAAIFDGLNAYLGNYIGEFLGELSFNGFFLLSSWTLIRDRSTGRWVGIAGLVVGVAGLVGMCRNVTVAVAPVAAFNNYLLPLWMIVFGVVLLRWRTSDASSDDQV